MRFNSLLKMPSIQMVQLIDVNETEWCDEAVLVRVKNGKGFVCALLDGHHKACAASALGKRLNCLTIIAPDNFRFIKGTKYADGDTLIEKVGFAGIMIDTEPGARMKDYLLVKGVKQKELNISEYHLTGRKMPERYISTYPTIQTLAGIINAEVDLSGNVVEYAKRLLLSRNEENAIKLDCLMRYLSESCKEEEYSIAKKILDEEDEYLLQLPRKSAIKELLKHRNEETEQYMINYLVNHDSKDGCWELVNSYWD